MQTTVEIQNLKCGGCATTILNKLKALKQVRHVFVDTDTSVVSFEYDTEDDLQQVTATLAKLGYPLVNEKNSLGKKAKSFVSCAMGRMATD